MYVSTPNSTGGSHSEGRIAHIFLCIRCSWERLHISGLPFYFASEVQTHREKGPHYVFFLRRCLFHLMFCLWGRLYFLRRPRFGDICVRCASSSSHHFAHPLGRSSSTFWASCSVNLPSFGSISGVWGPRPAYQIDLSPF